MQVYEKVRLKHGKANPINLPCPFNRTMRIDLAYIEMIKEYSQQILFNYNHAKF